MASKTIISIVEENAQDGVIVCSQNRTLYADQFTDEVPIFDEDREPFLAQNLQAVFEHYRPKKEIVLSTNEGDNFWVENFEFRELADFDDDRLIAQSKLLSALREKMETCDSTNNESMRCLSENLFLIHNEIRNLEITYRCLDTFFANAGEGDIDYLALMNVDKEELCDPSSEDTIAIQNEISRRYDCLSPADSYNLLVIPRIDDADAMRMWAQFAYKCRLIVITSYLDDFYPSLGNSDLDSLSDNNQYLGNAILTINDLLARRKTAHEFEDLYIPGSAALAGRISNPNEISSYDASNRKWQSLLGIKETRSDIHKLEADYLIRKGVIPIVKEDERVLALSTQTLYNGPSLILKYYRYVMAFNIFEKVVQTICNDCLMMNWYPQIESEVATNIQSFLVDYKQVNGIFKEFSNLKVRYEPKSRAIMVWIEVAFKCNQFVFRVTGENEKCVPEWNSHIFIL